MDRKHFAAVSCASLLLLATFASPAFARPESALREDVARSATPAAHAADPARRRTPPAVISDPDIVLTVPVLERPV
jgi:hypothetical protein